MIDRIASALSRRNLLMGLAASATAATVADAATAPEEDPELVAMADALPDVLAGYVAARDDVRVIVAEWSPQWPVPGEEIISYGNGCKEYRGIDGRGLQMACYPSRINMMPSLGTPESFEAGAKYHEARAAQRAVLKSQRNMKFHLRCAASDRARIEPARAYWSEVDRITDASGIEGAQDRERTALVALKQAVDRIMAADDLTIAGTVIKAQALAAWGEADRVSRMLNDRGPVWADRLAASIVKHAA